MATATAPATAAVPQPSLRLIDVLALAVIAIIAAPIIIDAEAVLAVSGLMLMASAVAAAPVPGGGLSPKLNQIWEETFGRAFGKFPVGPDYLGDGVDAPGDCSGEQLKALEADKKMLCGKPSACKGNDCDQSVINEKISNKNACIEKRVEIMLTCFRGGDAAHWGQVTQQLEGLLKCKNCLAKALGNQCKK